MTPRVSVIIPCYNSEKWLKETIQSVFEQTFEEFETILVDDGSTDKTSEIIRSFGEKTHAIVLPHRGVSAARNAGTQQARGVYIQYLDSDDLLDKNALKQRVEALEQSGADVAYSDWQELLETREGMFQKGKIFTRQIEEVHTDPQIAIFTEFWAPPAALLYKKSIVCSIEGWNQTLPVVEDARFLLDAALRGGHFIHCPGVTAYYRKYFRDSSLSRRDPIAFVHSCFINAEQIECWWKSHGGITNERKTALVKVYGYVARSSYRKDPAIFEQAYRALNRLEPNYCPQIPHPLKYLTKMVGYRKAEEIAHLYRCIKRRFIH